MPSYQTYQSGHFLTRNMMKWFWQVYAPESKQRQEAYASPLRAGTEKLRGLPPTLIQTAELE